MSSTTTQRRHSFSVKDYPEHLNPFREDEKAASKKHFASAFRQRLRPGLDNARQMISKLGSPALTRRSIRAVFRKGHNTNTKEPISNTNGTISSVEQRPRASTIESTGETTSYSRHTINGWNGSSSPSSPVAPPRSRLNSIGSPTSGSRYEDFTLPRSRRDREAAAGQSLPSPVDSPSYKGGYEQWSLPRPRRQREAEAAAAAKNAINPFEEEEDLASAAPVPLPRTRVSVAEEAASTSCMSTPITPRRGLFQGSGGYNSDVECSTSNLIAYNSIRRSYRKKKRAPLPPGLPTPPRNPETSSTPISSIESQPNDSISSLERNKENKLNISGISILSTDMEDEKISPKNSKIENTKDEIVSLTNIEQTKSEMDLKLDDRLQTENTKSSEENTKSNENINNSTKDEQMINSKEEICSTKDGEQEITKEITSNENVSRNISLKDILNKNSDTNKIVEKSTEEMSQTSMEWENHKTQNENEEASQIKSFSSNTTKEENNLPIELNKKTLEKTTFQLDKSKIIETNNEPGDKITASKQPTEEMHKSINKEDIEEIQVENTKETKNEKEKNEESLEAKLTSTPPPTPLKKKMTTIENLSLFNDDLDSDMLTKSPTFKDLPTYTCSFGKTTRTRLPKLEIVE